MSEEIDKHVLRRYQIVDKVGKGAYGSVKALRPRRPRSPY